MAITAVTAGIRSNFLSNVGQLPVSGMEQIGAIMPNPGVVVEQQIAVEPAGRWRIVARDAPVAASRARRGIASFVTSEFRQAGRAGASAGICSRARLKNGTLYFQESILALLSGRGSGE